MKSYVYVNGKVKNFDCGYNEIPEKYKTYPVLQYRTNRMSCTEWTQLYNSGWQIKESDHSNPIRLIDPLKEERYLNGSYLPDLVNDIFKIISFPNWEIANNFLYLEEELKRKNDQVDYLAKENERLREEIKELKEKVTKRNRLIKKLRGNCQAIII